MADVSNGSPEPLTCQKPFQFRLRTLFYIVTGFAVLLSSCNVLDWWDGYCQGPISARGFNKVTIGMTLAEVEKILGPGQQIPVEYVVQAPGAPNAMRKGNLDLVIDGDVFFQWTHKKYTRLIQLGMRDGKVCDKFIYEPSL